MRVFFSHDRKNSIPCIDNDFVERRRRRQKQQNYLPNKRQTINSTAYGFAKSIFVLPYNNNARSKLSTRRHNGIFRGKNNNLLSPPHAIRRIQQYRPALSSPPFPGVVSGHTRCTVRGKNDIVFIFNFHLSMTLIDTSKF